MVPPLATPRDAAGGDLAADVTPADHVPRGTKEASRAMSCRTPASFVWTAWSNSTAVFGLSPALRPHRTLDQASTKTFVTPQARRASYSRAQR